MVLPKQDPKIKKTQDDIKDMKSRLSLMETRKNKLLAVLNKEEGKNQRHSRGGRTLLLIRS